MKNLLKTLTLFALVLSAANCSKKQETEISNADEQIVESSPSVEAIVDPILVKGQELFEGQGTCIACHKPDAKVVGPSIKEIVKIYKENGASIATFINGEGKPLVDPSQYEIMKANFTITKAMSAEDRKALEVYMMSFE